MMIQQENQIFKSKEHLDYNVQVAMEVLDYEKFSSTFNGDYGLSI